MITVHHLENSRSLRILWLLEELQLPYEIRHYARDPITRQAPPELKAIHPLGKAPAIDDDGIVMAESGAIIEYLADTYGEGRLKPATGIPARRQYTYWLHYGEGSLMPLVLTILRNRFTETGLAARQKQNDQLEPYLRQHMEFVDRHLAYHRWFAGDELSGADIQMAFILDMISALWPPAREMGSVQAYLEQVRARPAYQAAEAKGGANDFNFGK